MRDSLKACPLPMDKDDPYYPVNDRQREDLSREQIPFTDSLSDSMERGRILPMLRLHRCFFDDPDY